MAIAGSTTASYRACGVRESVAVSRHQRGHGQPSRFVQRRDGRQNQTIGQVADRSTTELACLCERRPCRLGAIARVASDLVHAISPEFFEARWSSGSHAAPRANTRHASGTQLRQSFVVGVEHEQVDRQFRLVLQIEAHLGEVETGERIGDHCHIDIIRRRPLLAAVAGRPRAEDEHLFDCRVGAEHVLPTSGSPRRRRPATGATPARRAAPGPGGWSWRFPPARSPPRRLAPGEQPREPPSAEECQCAAPVQPPSSYQLPRTLHEDLHLMLRPEHR